MKNLENRHMQNFNEVNKCIDFAFLHVFLTKTIVENADDDD